MYPRPTLRIQRKVYSIDSVAYCSALTTALVRLPYHRRPQLTVLHSHRYRVR